MRTATRIERTAMKEELGNKILITFAPRGYFAKHCKQMF